MRDLRANHRRLQITSTAVALLTFFTFLPALKNGFVNWDDASNFLNNPNYRGFSWEHLRWMFSSFHLSVYVPLSWLSYSIDYAVWGMNPIGYHLTNIILHSLNAALFFFIMYDLLITRNSTNLTEANAVVESAAIAALLFSIHPLRVESVAWITERRDVLSGFFFLWTVLLYVKACAYASASSSSVKKLRLFSYGTYLLSLSAKATGMTLPVLLWVLDLVLSRATLRRIFCMQTLVDLKKQWPYFILSLPFALLAIHGQNQSSTLVSVNALSLQARVIIAIHAFFFYLQKTLWPFSLTPFYEIPVIIFQSTWGQAAWSLLTLGGSFLLAAILGPWVLLASVWYAIALLPNSGLFQTGFQMTADRYSYLPCMCWAALFGAGFFRFLRKSTLARVGAILLCLCLMLLSWRQVLIWHDSYSLWQYALHISPDSQMAHNMLGRALIDQGHPSEAINHFEQALANPFTALQAHNNLGAALASEGRLKEALPHFQYVMEQTPNDLNARRNYAKALDLLSFQNKISDVNTGQR